MTPADIRGKEFDKAAVFGYKNEQVDAFIDEVARDMEALLAEKDDLQKKIVFLAEKIEELRSNEENVKEAFIKAQQSGEEVMNEAKTRAGEILKNAEESAAKITEIAENKVEIEKRNLDRLRAEVGEFRNRLLNIYKTHLTFITNMPEPDEEPNKEPEKESAFEKEIGEKFTPSMDMTIEMKKTEPEQKFPLEFGEDFNIED